MSLVLEDPPSREVLDAVKAQNWEKASTRGDGVCYRAVTENKNWIWEQVRGTKITKEWNDCSYGNVAICIHYGQKFPERHAQIEELKRALSTP